MPKILCWTVSVGDGRSRLLNMDGGAGGDPELSSVCYNLVYGLDGNISNMFNIRFRCFSPHTVARLGKRKRTCYSTCCLKWQTVIYLWLSRRYRCLGITRHVPTLIINTLSETVATRKIPLGSSKLRNIGSAATTDTANDHNG